jgi:hypothetical protein
MSLDQYTLLLFLAGFLAGVAAAILAYIAPDVLRAIRGIWRLFRAPRVRRVTDRNA